MGTQGSIEEAANYFPTIHVAPYFDKRACMLPKVTHCIYSSAST